ncbi:hypothetical protein BTO09_05055 [Gilvibacter sp. SZ-19]|jgi:hypothetical protein|nr:hypothetical protein BTO09_05055 [Gilvibacter sp. SZ-19]
MAQDETLEKLQLKVGESASTLDMQLQFTAVVMDSRCPSDAQCVMAGWADVEVLLITADGEKQALKVRIDASEQHMIHPIVMERADGVRIVVGKLTPYPLSTVQFADREYCLELWVYEDQ